ncbi:hydrogenase nickel incorporation protein HypB [Desulfogranum mediterraneum]|uniref:hydrogenase nickel incorporation protein HypB n=1 Tax=Desulfogranum mediterraneum TaxID=160661 RepID=UPI000401F6E5|nr:hydrogenase nickel incorporation protein HypB [Desulfogranum mediterraneum]
MCDVCGCQLHDHHQSDPTIVEVNQNLLNANQKQADSNRRHIEKMGAIAINLISSPGSGKTTLLERTIDALGDQVRIGVIEGDIETERDADRIRAKGVPAVQLTTGGACHLDAPMVHGGLHVLEHLTKNSPLDLIFIENVGNLVCPATFDLGEHCRIILLSVPEGSDKPVKYPTTFKGADCFMITKTDLQAHFDFSAREAREEALKIQPDLDIIELSATSGDNFEQWIDYLQQLLAGR